MIVTTVPRSNSVVYMVNKSLQNSDLQLEGGDVLNAKHFVDDDSDITIEVYIRGCANETTVDEHSLDDDLGQCVTEDDVSSTYLTELEDEIGIVSLLKLCR